MARALWLADALRAEGVTVVEYAGWRERGSSTFTPKGLICHHTAGPAKGDAPSLGICVNGRSDLPGPLAQVVLARSGTAHVIASGRANHAGKGSWKGITGNTNMLGIEAENTGVGEPWPLAQIEAYIRCAAAMARHLGFSVDMICGHKEWAPGRKPDPRGTDMGLFRAQVATRLHSDRTKPPAPLPPRPAPTRGNDDMTPEQAHQLSEALRHAAEANLRTQDAITRLERVEQAVGTRDINGPFLVPGYGAQGGTVADLTRIFGRSARFALPSSSREVLQAGPHVSALRDAAQRGIEAVSGLSR